jgi:HemK-related putative methylase
MTTLYRSVWGHLLAWRFRLFHRHRHRNLVLERIDDCDFVVLPDVFNPALFRTGPFLVGQLDRIAPGMHVLDMGTGSGIAAVFAARSGAQVVAVDINPAAVRCARINALLNDVDERMCVRQGDLFAPVLGEQFDLIVFNPPFYRGTPRDAYDHAWRGLDVAERFAAGLSDHLKSGGRTLLVLSSDGEDFLDAFSGFTVKTLATRDLINEILTIYEVCPS